MKYLKSYKTKEEYSNDIKAKKKMKININESQFNRLICLLFQMRMVNLL